MNPIGHHYLLVLIFLGICVPKSTDGFVVTPFTRYQVVPKPSNHPSASTSTTTSTSLTTSATGSITTAGEQGPDVKGLKRKLTKEFLSIGAPAFIQLAAEPLAALVDTAYLGRLGPEVLGGAGVAISAQYAVSKLYNDPLLRTSISMVASKDGQTRGKTPSESDRESLSIEVSSALLLAFVVGIIQLFVYTVLAKGITLGMGVTEASPMWHSAVSYLRVRALGTPAATLWLVTNGIFRGLGDTRTPLFYSLLFTGLNAILDPLFIFTFHFGASGAAAGTAIAQYVALVPLMLALNRKVKIDIIGQLSKLGDSLKSYLSAGSLVLVRTLGKVFAYSVCAREAALLGPVAAAAYNLTFQLGFATTQICESVAVAVQTLLARELADTTTYPQPVRRQLIRHLINTSILIGGGVAGLLSLTTFFQRDSILRGLTSNAAIRDASAAIFPVVLVTQTLKGLAYPVNGIVMGGLDWIFSMIAMWTANFACVGLVRFFAMNGTVGLGKIWWALAAFMGCQVVTGILRVESKTGVWRALRKEET
ncbi:Protein DETOXIFICATION [Seminavis robusta]|uniref:Protein DETOXIFICATION n=1 Tax=Seminavis robusta TaxID=568900 RepID=A0A9N8E2M8_9STRA|nr:Protein DETOXIFICATION [Seminavis robusta]|eukprot:Sro555_g165670.1 Protein DETOXIFICATION (535) ;mRNA; r:16590-18745